MRIINIKTADIRFIVRTKKTRYQNLEKENITIRNLYMRFDDCLPKNCCEEKLPKWNPELATHYASKVK